MGLVKKISDFFTGNDKPIDPSRRGFLKIAATTVGCAIIASSNIACLKGDNILIGEPIYRETDNGPISQEAIDRFSLGVTSDPGVYSLEKELAEVINKTYEYAFNESLDSKLGIKFKNDSRIGKNHDAVHLVDYKLNGIERKEHSTIIVRPGLPMYGAFKSIAHEIGHEFGNEAIAFLTNAMLGLATLATPKFGEADKYRVVKSSVHDLFEQFNNYVNSNSVGLDPFSNQLSEHKLGGLAALIALNRFDGDSKLAHTHLKRNEYFYNDLARSFIDSCYRQSDLDGVIQSFKEYSGAPIITTIETKPYYQVAFTEFLNLVRFQLIRATLNKMGISDFNLQQTLTNEISHPAQMYFKPGFTHPMIYRPADYQDQIPKGE